MISERKAVFSLLAGLVTSLVAASCLDVAPIVVASSSNASSQSRACAACYAAPDVPGPGCSDELTACYADEKCNEAFLCSVHRGCFQGATEELIKCGTECATEAGFTSLDDKAYALANTFYTCLLGPCKDACFGAAQDAGPVTDASQEQPSPSDATPDATADASSQNCLAPGVLNELGFGGFCTKTSECPTTAGLRFCTADFDAGTFCTGLCSTDLDCGTGAYCAHQGPLSGCVPRVCGTSTGEAGVASDGAVK